MDYIHPSIQAALSKVRPLFSYIQAFFMLLWMGVKKGATHPITHKTLHWVYQKTLGEGGLSEKTYYMVQTYGPKLFNKALHFIKLTIRTFKG